MPRRRASPLRSLVIGAGVTLAASRGAAQVEPGSACDEQRLRVEGLLSPQWFEPVVHLCETLSSMKYVDKDARLRLVGAGEDVIVEVVLGDGRTALRRVHTPSDLPLTVEALVAVPPPRVLPPVEAPPVEAPPAEASSPLPAAPEVEPSAASAEATPAIAKRTHVVPPVHGVGLELGGSLVARISGNPIYASLGATGYVGMRSAAWMLALAARWDGYQTVLDERPSDFEMTTAGAGVQFVRSIVSRPGVAFEGGLTAWLLGVSQAAKEGAAERSGSLVDMRLGLLSRVVIGQGRLRWTASVDAELSPTRLRHDLHLARGLPILPAWSTGFGAGIAWEPQ